MFDIPFLILSTLVSVGVTAFIVISLYYIIRLLKELVQYLHKLNNEDD